MAGGFCIPCGGGAEGAIAGLQVFFGSLLFLGTVAGACLGRRFENTTDPVTGQKKLGVAAKVANTADKQKTAAAANAGGNMKGGTKGSNQAKILVNNSQAGNGLSTSTVQQSARRAGKAVPSIKLSMCDGLAEKLKIFAAFCQVTNLFYETLKIPWPAAITDLYAALGIFNFDIFQLMSVGCFTGTFYYQFIAVMVRCLSVCSLPCELSIYLITTGIPPSNVCCR